MTEQFEWPSHIWIYERDRDMVSQMFLDGIPGKTFSYYGRPDRLRRVQWKKDRGMDEWAFRTIEEALIHRQLVIHKELLDLERMLDLGPNIVEGH